MTSPKWRAGCGRAARKSEFAGIADQDIELAIAVQKCRRHFVDFNELAEVERDESGRSAYRSDRVVNLFETADGACRQDDMCALASETNRNRGADAARGPRYQHDFAG